MLGVILIVYRRTLLEFLTWGNIDINNSNLFDIQWDFEGTISTIITGKDFANMMSCLMSDLVEGAISPGVGNATCNAGGKLLKVVEMTYKYGTNDGNEGSKKLSLTFEQ